MESMALKLTRLISYTLCIAVLMGCDDESNPLENPLTVDESRSTLELNEESYLLATTQDDIYKISALTGEVERAYEGPEFPLGELLAPADVVDNIAYVSTTDNAIRAYDLDAGEFVWGYTHNSFGADYNLSAPVCSANFCYVIANSSVLVAYDIQTRERAWSKSLDGEAFSGNETIRARFPVIVNGVIYIGVDYTNGSFAFNAYSLSDGSLLKSITSLNQIAGPAIVVDGKILIRSNRILFAIDQSTFDLIWQTESEFIATDPVVVDDVVVSTIVDFDNKYIPSNVGTAGLDLNTGQILWTRPNIGLDIVFRPTTDGSTAVIMTPALANTAGFAVNEVKGIPTGINVRDGTTIWDLQEEREFVSEPPLAVPGYLFFTDHDPITLSRNIASINSFDGSTIWRGLGNNSFRRDIFTSATLMVLVHDGEVIRPSHFPTLSKSIR